jgi:ribose transport system ATP-binding protein
MCAVVLRMTGVEKQFGSIRALDNVSFELEQGEIHALVGTNGAGKSTLINILSGVYLKDAGTIEFKGRNVEFTTPGDAIDHGVATVHQNPELAPRLTGFENIYLGREFSQPSLFRRFNRAALRKRADDLLVRFPIDIDLDCQVHQLNAVEREVIAVLHALARDDISILILDEPTSILTDHEKPLLFHLMRTLKTAGISIIYITHQLAEVFDIADRFTIFLEGRNVGTYRSQEAKLCNLPIADIMLGQKMQALYPARSGFRREVYLEAHRLAKLGAFEELDLVAHRGEIVGIFGLVGSGIDALSKTLFGVTHPTGGTLSLFGKPVKLTGPHDALRRGIYLVPGDRRTEGLTLTRDVTFNMTLANLGRACGPCGYLRLAEMYRSSRLLAERVALQPPLLTRDVQTFSGGNQQKIVIAKGLYAAAQVYIFVEPTVGVDIGARAKVYGLMRELTDTAALIVMSSDCDEVCGIADRVIALHKGRMVYEGVASTRDELLMAGIMGLPQPSGLRPVVQ